MLWELSDKDKRMLMSSRVILSMSGGKDSTACALLLERNKIPFECIFMDTGWEHPVLYKYITEVLEPRFGPVKVLRSEKFPDGMKGAIRHKGIFPSRRIRYCTEQLKIIPRDKYLKSLDDDSIVHVLGVRRAESASRAKYSKWSRIKSLDIDLFCPLVDHSFDDVIAMHTQGGLAPNPLYLMGMERVGCFPCIYARKSEVSMLGKLFPQRVEEIEALENEIGGTYFGARVGGKKASIRDVVSWSNTSRGGKQFRLFDSTAQDGCTRWGMCDSAMSANELMKMNDGGE